MGERLKELRKFFNLTQKSFAEKIGIKQNTVASYEIGRNVPIDAVISLICREFRVREDWLRTGEGDMFVSLSKEEQIAEWMGSVFLADENTIQKKLIAVLASLTVEEWALIASFAEKLSNQKKED